MSFNFHNKLIGSLCVYCKNFHKFKASEEFAWVTQVRTGSEVGPQICLPPSLLVYSSAWLAPPLHSQQCGGPFHFLPVMICNPGNSLLDKCSFLPGGPVHFSLSYAVFQPTTRLSCRGRADKLQPRAGALKGTYNLRWEKPHVKCDFSLWAEGNPSREVPRSSCFAHLRSTSVCKTWSLSASNRGHSHTPFSGNLWCGLGLSQG